MQDSYICTEMVNSAGSALMGDAVQARADQPMAGVPEMAHGNTPLARGIHFWGIFF